MTYKKSIFIVMFICIYDDNKEEECGKMLNDMKLYEDTFCVCVYIQSLIQIKMNGMQKNFISLLFVLLLSS
jgi:hypothetical protein